MSAVGDSKVKSWMPAVPLKAPDNIISSEFSSRRVFVPSYEKEKRPCMEQLLTNEYQRIWWHEKETWDRVGSKTHKTKKLLQRTVIKRKPPTAPQTKPPRVNKQKPKKVEKTTEEAVAKLKETPQKKEKSSKKEQKRTAKVKKDTTEETANTTVEQN